MILYLNLLMVLFILQYQNCSAQENEKTNGTKSTSPTTPPILTSQPSTTTTALTNDNTTSVSQESTTFTHAPTLANKMDLTPTLTSSANSRTTPYEGSTTSGVSKESTTFTHAPSHANKTDLTPTLTSSANSTSRTTPYEGSTTSGFRNTSDFHTTISPTANFSISPTPIDLDINCSHIAPKIVTTSVNISEYSATVMFENMSAEELKLNLNCNKNNTKENISTYIYTFQDAKQCTNLNVECNFNERNCISPIIFSVPIPLYSNFTLDLDVTENSIQFEWDKTELLDACRINESYICTDQNNHTKDFLRDSRKVIGLEPYTNYSCTVKLIYNNNTEIYNDSKVIKTKAGKPGEVKNLKCFHNTSTSITITWEEPESPNGPLPGYIVRNDSTENVFITDTDRLSYNFTELDSYKEYTLFVKAVNNKTDKYLHGKEIEIKCRTDVGKPESIEQSPTVKLTSNNAIEIDCQYPKKMNGPKKEMHLNYSGEYKTSFGKIQKHPNCHFRIEDLNYLTNYTFKLTPFNGKEFGLSTEVSIKTKYNDKALIGFLVFFIIITTLALLLVLFKIYKLQRGSSSQCEILPLVNQDDEKQLLNIDPIPVEVLLETYKKKNADEGRLFLDEFQSIPRVFSKFSIKEARKSSNQSKNRYIDILPYDDNRVVLSGIQGEPGSDYINASYVNGFKEPRKYIAAQGPKDETVYDFWRMVWEQKSTIIVMVTRCEEGNRNKCAQYWPSLEDESATYNEIVLKITEEKIFPDYITRKLHINNEKERSERDVTHIQFTVWPDHGVPDDPNLLLKLRRRVNALNNFFSGPIIVHCSAGVGRTGTYVSIDAMLEGLEAEGRVDVYGYVVQLRRQRCLMVQVESQYIFIHKCLVEYSQFGETEVSIPELPHSLNNLKSRDPPSEPSQLESEFQRLPSYRNWRLQKAGNDQNNKDLNRNPKVIPYDYNRVQIKLEEEQPNEENEEDSEYSSDEGDTEDATKYINASYIIGFWGTRSVIATQGPLENTVSDFWQMIFQKKVKAIVTLSAPSQENKEAACFPYWEQKKETHEDLEVELTNEKSCGSYTERTFQITYSKKTDKRTVCQFHYEQWKEELPGNPKELLNMIEKIRKEFPDKRVEEASKHDKSASLVVHCSDGSKKTGTFCALWNLMESAHIEGVIDVFQTVKNIRKQRPGMVSSLEHYQFLYDIIASTVPAQNGQIKTPNRQEDTVEIQNEVEVKVPVVKEKEQNDIPQDDEIKTKPKEDESTSNGPAEAPFTEVTLRIDE
uniref:Receptor-type tyrosine-protein phosphatase C n=1 Tax=Xenopus tropicalis TaxID=8364 RepID=A0A803JPQ8_XENTR